MTFGLACLQARDIALATHQFDNILPRRTDDGHVIAVLWENIPANKCTLESMLPSSTDSKRRDKGAVPDKCLPDGLICEVLDDYGSFEEVARPPPDGILFDTKERQFLMG